MGEVTSNDGLIKIFISKRKASDSFLDDLMERLNTEPDLQVLSQADMQGDDLDKSQVEYANRADVAVFLFSLESCAPAKGEAAEDRLDPYAGLLTGFHTPVSCQVDEAEAVGRRARDHEAAPKVISVFLDVYERAQGRRPSWAPRLDVAALSQELAKRPQTQWLTKRSIVPVTPGGQETAARTDAVEVVVEAIMRCVSDLRVRVGLDAPEQAYLERESENWVNGCLHEDLSGTQNSLIDFAPSRFLELGVRRTIKGSPLLPVHEALFQRGRHPVILLAEAGSGKTTSVATAALTMAARWGGAMERQARRIVRQRPFPMNGPRHVPVVLRASRVAAQARARNVFSESSDMLYDAIGVLLLGQETPPRAAIDYARLRRSILPYAVFIDGLDEIDNFKIERVLRKAAASLHADLEDKGGTVALTRRSGEQLDDEFDWLELQRPTPSQARRYVLRACGGDKRLARHAARKALSLMRGPEGVEIMSKPLSLSAFMGLVHEGAVVEQPSDILAHTIHVKLREDVTGYAPKDLEPILNALALAVSFGAGEDGLSRAEVLQSVERDAEALGLLTDGVTPQALLKVILKSGLLIEDRPAPDVVTLRFRIAAYREVMASARLREVFEAGGDALPVGVQPRRLAPVAVRAILKGMRGPPLHRLLRACLANLDAGIVREAEFRSDWLTHTARMLAAIGADERARDAELVRITGEVEAAYVADSPSWTPPLRDRVLEALYALVRQDDPVAHAAALEDMRARLFPEGAHWAPWPHPTENGQPAWLAAAPVTVAAFRAFMHETGALQQMTRAQFTSFAYAAVNWGGDDRADIPVVGVTWDEAVRFAQHLTQKARREGRIGDGEILRLPTLGEWRGFMAFMSNGRRYPWGMDEEEEHTVNRLGNGLDWPSSSGAYDSYGLHGLYDFGSNVCCWLIPDRDGQDVWPPRLDGVDPRGGGGSWMKDLRFCDIADTSAYRSASARESDLGLRLVRTTGAAALYGSR